MLVLTWELSMPRIPDQMLDCVFYLYPSLSAAEAGEQFGGCGFFLTFPFERAKQNHLYAVTNRHVISGGSNTLRINAVDGRCFSIDSDERKWFNHPDGDDISVLLVDFPIAFECRTVTFSVDSFVTSEKTQEFDIGIGDDVFTVGRFVNHEGKQKNTPVVRFGNISQMPLEAIMQQDGHHLQESYLVEARSVGGYSGSPVFVYIPSFATRPKTGKQVSSASYGPWLLGIVWGHLNDWKPVCDAQGRPLDRPHPESMQVGQNSGMMGVVPIWKLIELLNHPTAVAQRQDRETQILGIGATAKT
jgi:hypothetical protein